MLHYTTLHSFDSDQISFIAIIIHNISYAYLRLGERIKLLRINN
jgi:hypothetical protein